MNLKRLFVKKRMDYEKLTTMHQVKRKRIGVLETEREECKGLVE
jgi:hypothetical protein